MKDVCTARHRCRTLGRHVGGIRDRERLNTVILVAVGDEAGVGSAEPFPIRKSGRQVQVVGIAGGAVIEPGIVQQAGHGVGRGNRSLVDIVEEDGPRERGVRTQNGAQGAARHGADRSHAAGRSVNPHVGRVRLRQVRALERITQLGARGVEELEKDDAVRVVGRGDGIRLDHVAAARIARTGSRHPRLSRQCFRIPDLKRGTAISGHVRNDSARRAKPLPIGYGGEIGERLNFKIRIEQRTRPGRRRGVQTHLVKINGTGHRAVRRETSVVETADLRRHRAGRCQAGTRRIARPSRGAVRLKADRFAVLTDPGSAGVEETEKDCDITVRGLEIVRAGRRFQPAIGLVDLARCGRPSLQEQMTEAAVRDDPHHVRSRVGSRGPKRRTAPLITRTAPAGNAIPSERRIGDLESAVREHVDLRMRKNRSHK